MCHTTLSPRSSSSLDSDGRPTSNLHTHFSGYVARGSSLGSHLKSTSTCLRAFHFKEGIARSIAIMGRGILPISTVSPLLDFQLAMLLSALALNSSRGRIDVAELAGNSLLAGRLGHISISARSHRVRMSI